VHVAEQDSATAGRRRGSHLARRVRHYFPRSQHRPEWCVDAVAGPAMIDGTVADQGRRRCLRYGIVAGRWRWWPPGARASIRTRWSPVVACQL